MNDLFDFHVCLKGLEKVVLCRDSEDFDVMVKIMAVCALRKNVSSLAYCAVSNHLHDVVKASSQEDALAFAEEIKKMYGMFFSRKYNEPKVLKNSSVSAIWVDSSWYLRNAVVYALRNALDNGAVSVQDYPWSSYNAYFNQFRMISGSSVSSLTRREKERIMHTCDDLSSVNWLLDDNLRLIPASICDWASVEKLFNGDQTFFLKCLGSVNAAEMQVKLVDNPRRFLSDAELLVAVNDICRRWFKMDLKEIPIEKKARLLTYVFHSYRTSAAQLARVFKMGRDTVESMI